MSQEASLSLPSVSAMDLRMAEERMAWPEMRSTTPSTRLSTPATSVTRQQ